MTVTITLTIAGADTGPFLLFSDADGYSSAFESGVTKAALEAGYTSVLVPPFTTTIRVISEGTCTNYIDIPIDVLSYCYTAECIGGAGECLIGWVDANGNPDSATIDDTKVKSITFCAKLDTPNIVSCTGAQIASITGGTFVCTNDVMCPTTTTTTTQNPYLLIDMCFTVVGRSQGLLCTITGVGGVATGVYNNHPYYELVCNFNCPLGPSSRTVYVIYSVLNTRWESWDTFDPILGPSGTLLASLVTTQPYPEMLTSYWDNYTTGFRFYSSVDVSKIGGFCATTISRTDVFYEVDTCSSGGVFEIDIVSTNLFTQATPYVGSGSLPITVYPGYLLQVFGTTGSGGTTTITILEGATVVFTNTYPPSTVIPQFAANAVLGYNNYIVQITETC